MGFLLADALNNEWDTIFTCGGVQSNHCRATAVAARQLGLDCYLFLRRSEQVSCRCTLYVFLQCAEWTPFYISHLYLMPLMFGPITTLARIYVFDGTRKTFLEQGLRTNNKWIYFHSIQTSGTFTLLEGVCSHSPNFYSTTLVLPSNQTLIILLNPSTIDKHGEGCLKKVEPWDRQSR